MHSIVFVFSTTYYSNKTQQYIIMENKYSLPNDGGLILSGIPTDIIHRYEKIPTSIFDIESEGVNYVADTITKAIAKHNAAGSTKLFALGLATGRTPL